MSRPVRASPALEESLEPSLADGSALLARIPGFDALRGALTLLVVFHHAAITYGASGGWFYREVPVGHTVSSTLLVFFCSVNQAYFMGFFFLLAGYLTPSAIERHGALRYLRERFRRLGLPLLFFGWVLAPITIAMSQTAHGRPFYGTLERLLRGGAFDVGPLWFAEALLIFAVAAVAITSLRRERWPNPRTPWPSDVWLFAAALATGFAAVALRRFWPVGMNVWNLQLGYFASYVVLFAFGCIAAHPRWLERLTPTRVRMWWRIAKFTLPVLPVVYFLGRAVPALREPVLGTVYAFWEPFVAWGVILKLLEFAQRRGIRLEGAWDALARRAYTIFIIHPPVLVAVALAWRDVYAPALLKFAVTGTLACALCFGCAGLLLRIPGLRRLL